MKAQVLRKIAPIENCPLEFEDMPIPRPGDEDVLVKVSVCGVCHTELDEVEGRLSAKLPVIPGHQIVGRVAGSGSKATRFRIGERVGIAWICSACGKCRFCLEGPDYIGTPEC